MSQRITATFDDDTAAAIKRLAAMEQRSESQMVAILVEKRIAELRQEWAQAHALPSLPETPPRRRRRKIDNDFEEKFGR